MRRLPEEAEAEFILMPPFTPRLLSQHPDS